MRPISFNFPGQSVNAICATQTTASNSSAIINGSNLDFGELTVGVRCAVVAPGVQQSISVTSTGNLSAATVTITGVDVNNVAISTSMAGPNNSTVFTGLEFHKVTGVSWGVAGSVDYTVGIGATGTLRWSVLDTYKNPFSVSIQTAISPTTATTVSVTVAMTDSNPNTASAVAVFATSAVTANTYTTITTPMAAVRATFTTASTTGGQVTIVQAGR